MNIKPDDRVRVYTIPMGCTCMHEEKPVEPNTEPNDEIKIGDMVQILGPQDEHWGKIGLVKDINFCSRTWGSLVLVENVAVPLSHVKKVSLDQPATDPDATFWAAHNESVARRMDCTGKYGQDRRGMLPKRGIEYEITHSDEMGMIACLHKDDNYSMRKKQLVALQRKIAEYERRYGKPDENRND